MDAEICAVFEQEFILPQWKFQQEGLRENLLLKGRRIFNVTIVTKQLGKTLSHAILITDIKERYPGLSMLQ